MHRMCLPLALCGPLVAATLIPGQSVDMSIAAGAAAELELSAQPGLLELVIHGRGARLAVSGPLSADLSAGPARAVRLCWLQNAADTPGSLQIRSLEATGERKYRLRLTARPHSPSAESQARGCALQSQARSAATVADRAKTLAAARDAFRAANDSQGLGEVLTPLGEALWELGKSADAMAAHAAAVAAWEQLGDSGRKAEAMVLLARGHSLLGQREQRGLPMLQDALALARQSGDTLAEAAVLSMLVEESLTVAVPGDAAAMARDAIAIYQAAGDRACESVTWNRLGQWLQKTSLPEAANAFNMALALRREILDEAGAAQTINNLATVHSQAGDVQKAIALLEEALAIRLRLGAPLRVANTQHNLGVEYFKAGDYLRAADLYDTAMEIWRSTGFKLGHAATLAELATLYSAQGAYDRAERVLLQALALNRELQNQRAESNVLRHLGDVSRARRQFAQSLDYNTRAAAIAGNGNFQLEHARARSGLGLTLAATGRHKEAIAEFRRAAPLALSISRTDFVHITVALAHALRESGDVAESLRQFDEAETAAAQMESSRDLYAIAAGRALSLLAAGDAAAARQQSLVAIAHLERMLSTVSSPRARAEYFAGRHDVFHSAASALMRLGETAAAFAASERGRARSLADILAGTPTTPLSIEERKLSVALSAKSALLTRLLIARAPQSRIATARAEVTRLSDDYAAITERAARQHPEFARAAQPVTLAQIQSRLGPADAVLAYLLGRRNSFAWLVTASGIRGLELPDAAAIADAALESRERLTAPAGSSPAPALAHLARHIFGPLRPTDFARFRKVYVVPDGPLHSVPFAAFSLLQNKDVAVLPAAGILAQLPASLPPSALPKVAVFADPVYEPGDSRLLPPSPPAASTPRGADDTLRFPRLRFSAQEADAIAKSSRGVQTFTGIAASRTALLAAPLQPFDILHFATHAITDPVQPELSAIVLSLYDTNSRPVDGFLRMYDVPRLRLRSPLVVLSACDTALGRRLDGEGPLGISRSFLASGASGVLATLWPVDDAATAEWMAAFYRALLIRKLSPAAAVRQAQSVVRSQPRWAHPYYWAGFIYTGR